MCDAANIAFIELASCAAEFRVRHYALCHGADLSGDSTRKR